MILFSKCRIYTLLLLLSSIIFSSCYQQRRMVNGMNHLQPKDWAGTYQGILPCADCPGIETRIVFKDDGTYVRSSREMKDKMPSYTIKGTTTWNQERGLIILHPENSSLTYPYRLTKRGLIMMHLGTGQRQRQERKEYLLKKQNVSTEESITEHYWSLTELNGKPVKAQKPHILLHGGTGKTDGSGGCNRFNGTFELGAGQQVTVSPLSATRMACAGENVENEFFRTVPGTSTYEVKEDRLTLKRNGKVIARFEAVWMQ